MVTWRSAKLDVSMEQLVLSLRTRRCSRTQSLRSRASASSRTASLPHNSLHKSAKGTEPFASDLATTEDLEALSAVTMTPSR